MHGCAHLLETMVSLGAHRNLDGVSPSFLPVDAVHSELIDWTYAADRAPYYQRTE